MSQISLGESRYTYLWMSENVSSYAWLTQMIYIPYFVSQNKYAYLAYITLDESHVWLTYLIYITPDESVTHISHIHNSRWVTCVTHTNHWFVWVPHVTHLEKCIWDRHTYSEMTIKICIFLDASRCTHLWISDSCDVCDSSRENVICVTWLTREKCDLLTRLIQRYVYHDWLRNMYVICVTYVTRLEVCIREYAYIFWDMT